MSTPASLPRVASTPASGLGPIDRVVVERSPTTTDQEK